MGRLHQIAREELARTPLSPVEQRVLAGELTKVVSDLIATGRIHFGEALPIRISSATHKCESVKLSTRSENDHGRGRAATRDCEVQPEVAVSMRPGGSFV